ncbi:MAG: N-6 DNA methylase, partial [Methanosarcinales archaeon]
EFQTKESRVNLSTETSQKHFFDNFELEVDSVFGNLLYSTINLFNCKYGVSPFLTGAYDFWKKSYGIRPKDIPQKWKKIFENIGLNQYDTSDLCKFMFCLETSYAFFTHLVLIKACADYRFTGVDLFTFIKNEIENSSRGNEIPIVSWATLSVKLIDTMQVRLIKSVFEEDVFYWWTDEFKKLTPSDMWSPIIPMASRELSEAIANILLALCKYDFSEIVGDPLGDLYQKYFDKETRRALGEFYTPVEIVEYIIDVVGYKGSAILDKRLLDPACGSGTFLISALKKYLRVAEKLASEKGWDYILHKLCNEFHIVGFDIHPFAILLAQTQFMLTLAPYYKKAMEQNKEFVLRRLPIFRTDSLRYESKTEKTTLFTFGNRSVTVSLTLPIQNENKEQESIDLIMPNLTEVISESTGLLNIPEYFLALQALFDTVKESAKYDIYELDLKELEWNFKRYLQDKDMSKLVNFFGVYAKNFLSSTKNLKINFEDGRLIKSIEDLIIAGLLKNYVTYDFVVGNPPYVRKERISNKKE